MTPFQQITLSSSRVSFGLGLTTLFLAGLGLSCSPPAAALPVFPFSSPDAWLHVRCMEPTAWHERGIRLGAPVLSDYLNSSSSSGRRTPGIRTSSSTSIVLAVTGVCFC